MVSPVRANFVKDTPERFDIQMCIYMRLKDGVERITNGRPSWGGFWHAKKLGIHLINNYFLLNSSWSGGSLFDQEASRHNNKFEVILIKHKTNVLFK